MLEFEGFVRDVTDAANGSGVTIEQFHPEYGTNQFEISLAPLPPVAAADQLILTRIIVPGLPGATGCGSACPRLPFCR